MTTAVPFFRPSITSDDLARVSTCIRSGWLTTGTVCQEFEGAVWQVCGARHVVAFSSCTAALHAALAYQRLRPGDEVIVPDYTFVATASAVHHAGGTPVLVDVHATTLNLDASKLEEAVTPRTRGIVLVDLAGNVSGEIGGLRSWAHARRLFVIGDAAHSFGASFGGRPVGSLGLDATCFSFYATKNVTTGEGGALATDDPDLASFAKRFRLHGMDHDAWKRYGGAWRSYQVDEFGWKYNLPDVLAALGIGQVRRVGALTNARRRLAQRFHNALRDLPVELPWSHDPGHCWHLYMLRTSRRDALMAHLKERGIATAIHYPPLHTLKVLEQPDAAFPVATKAYREELSLPFYPDMTPEEEEYLLAEVRRFFEASR